MIDWSKPIEARIFNAMDSKDNHDWDDAYITPWKGTSATALCVWVRGIGRYTDLNGNIFNTSSPDARKIGEVRNKQEIIPNHPLIEMQTRGKEDFYPDPACMPRELTPEEIDKLNGFDMDKLNEYLTLRAGHEPMKELYEAIMVDIWTACGKELFNDYHEWQKATRILNEIADKIKERLGVE